MIDQLFHWRKPMREWALVAVEVGENVVSTLELKQLKVKTREIERLLAKKMMKAEVLREAIAIAREKTPLLRMPLPKKADSR